MGSEHSFEVHVENKKFCRYRVDDLDKVHRIQFEEDFDKNIPILMDGVLKRPDCRIQNINLPGFIKGGSMSCEEFLKQFYRK